MQRHRRDSPSSSSSSSAGASSPSSSSRSSVGQGVDHLAHPACPSQTEWKRLRWALDSNGTEVEVYQPDLDSTSKGSQWFYTVACRNHDTGARSPARDCPGCCIGIDHNRYALNSLPKFVLTQNECVFNTKHLFCLIF